MATTITLNWTAHLAGEGILKYQVFQSVNGGAMNFLADVPAGANPSHVILNPAPGVYAWSYRAVNFVGNGALGPVAQGPDIPSTGGVITVTVVNS